MITSNISVNRACPVYTYKIKKNNQQTSFKGNVSEKQNQGMTQEQKTWLAVGLTTVAAIAIGLIVWACSKGKKKPTKNVQKTEETHIVQPIEQKKTLKEILKGRNKWYYNELDILKPRYKTVEKMLENGGTKTIKFSKDVMDLNKKVQPHFIDMWFKQYNPDWEKVKVVPNVLADFESQNDFSLYEQMVLVPQLLGYKEQWEADKTMEAAPDNLYVHETHHGKGNYRIDEYEREYTPEVKQKIKDIYSQLFEKTSEKEIFIKYLKIRSEYFDKGKDFDVVRSEVLKNPSDDVVDAETLRLHMLANYTKEFLYSDESVEEPHNMLNFVYPLLIANYTAKMLEDFKPKKENLSENEKKYFEYMNKLGKFWHEKLNKEASEKLPNFVKMINGEIEKSKCYGSEDFDPRRLPNLNSRINFNFLKMLSRETKAKWNDGFNKKQGKFIVNDKTYYEKLSLNSYSLDLVENFKDRIWYNIINPAKSEINATNKRIKELIPEVLI